MQHPEMTMARKRSLDRTLGQHAANLAARASTVTTLRIKLQAMLSPSMPHMNEVDFTALTETTLHACEKQRKADLAAPSWPDILHEFMALIKTSVANTNDHSTSQGDGPAGEREKALEAESERQGASIPGSACRIVAPVCDQTQDGAHHVDPPAQRTGWHAAESPASSTARKLLQQEKERLEEEGEALCERREKAADLHRQKLLSTEKWQKDDEAFENLQAANWRELDSVKASIRAYETAQSDNAKASGVLRLWEENVTGPIRYKPLTETESADFTSSSAQTIMDDGEMARWLQTLQVADTVIQTLAPQPILPAGCDHFYWTKECNGPDPDPCEPPQRSRTFPITLCTPCITRVSAIGNPHLPVHRPKPWFKLVTRPAQQAV